VNRLIDIDLLVDLSRSETMVSELKDQLTFNPGKTRFEDSYLEW